MWSIERREPSTVRNEMGCEVIWNSTTLGRHSRALHDSESCVFKRHTPLRRESLPRKMRLNLKYCICFKDYMKPIHLILRGQNPQIKNCGLDFYQIPIYSYWRV